MGFFDSGYEAVVRNAEDDVRRAEVRLADKKRARDYAKKGTSYRNASKTYVEGGKKILNEYDYQIYIAQKYLKEAKERLAKAKEKARDAKKREQEKAKEAKHKEQETKKREKEEAKKAAAVSRAAVASSRSSSTSSSVKSSVLSASIAASLPKSSTSNYKPSTNTHTEPSNYRSETISSYSTKSKDISSSVNKSKEHNKAIKSPRKWVVTLILCLFFGVFGVHRFYVGKIGTGILQLFTAGGYFIWTFVDFVTILTGKFTDSKGNVIRL